MRRGDKEGDDAADIAADFGRLRQPEAVIDARRNLLRTKKEWYPGVRSLHRVMVAIARESLNVDHTWGAGAKVRKVGDRVIVELAQLPGPPGFLDFEWITLDSGFIDAQDVGLFLCLFWSSSRLFFLPCGGQQG